MTPNPKKAKNVSAMLAMMSATDGYFDGARRSGSMFASVETAKMLSMPITTTTTSVWTRATAFDPTTLSAVITTTTPTANTLAQFSSPSVAALLA